MIDVVLCALAAVAGAWGVRWAWRAPDGQLSGQALDFLAMQLLDDQVTLPVTEAEVRAFSGADARPYRVRVIDGKRFKVFEDGTAVYAGPARAHGYVSNISG